MRSGFLFSVALLSTACAFAGQSKPELFDPAAGPEALLENAAPYHPAVIAPQKLFLPPAAELFAAPVNFAPVVPHKFPAIVPLILPPLPPYIPPPPLSSELLSAFLSERKSAPRAELDSITSLHIPSFPPLKIPPRAPPQPAPVFVIDDKSPIPVKVEPIQPLPAQILNALVGKKSNAPRAPLLEITSTVALDFPAVIIPPPAPVPSKPVEPLIIGPIAALPGQTFTALMTSANTLADIPLIRSDFTASTPTAFPPIEIKAFAVQEPKRATEIPDPTNLTPTEVPKPTLPPLEKIELALKAENPAVAAGASINFTLTGPDLYLREALAEYVISDELGRQIAHDSLTLRNIKSEEIAGNNDPRFRARQFKITPPADVALVSVKTRGTPMRLHLDMTVHGRDKQHIKLGAELTITLPSVTETPTWDGWLSMAANPPAANSWEKLNKIGITGGMQYRLSATRRDVLRAGNAPFFVENVTRQLLSRYHTEKGLWQRTLDTMRSGRNSTTVLARDPSLCSTMFAETYAADIQRVAQVFVTDRPLFFSLASEPSVTRLNLPADFDFSPVALEEFRRWLERDVYGTLTALNELWGTKFESWQAIQPMTTDDARMRLHDGVGNFAPWVDFRDFQDYTFAKVLREGADRLRATIPNAQVGITGAMGPFAFGGWDWSRLAAGLDVVECYDIAGARALWRDLAPGKSALASINLPAPGADGATIERAELERTLWSFALEGGPRGALLWDVPQSETAFFDAKGELTESAQSVAPILNQLNGDLGKILAQGRREHDGVAVLYSPASIRLTWLFEADKLAGDKWLEQWGGDSSAERRDSLQLRLRESWGKLLDDLGIGWRYVASRDLEHGILSKPDAGIKTLILPRTIALSEREVEAIKKFTANGGRVIADAACARFDEHGKMRARGAFDEMFGVNTAGEPALPRPMKALERVKALPTNEGAAADWDLEFLFDLPPVFSDEPKWISTDRSLRRGAEYRMSPVLALGKNSTYLNLDLTDYLRWRLQPDSKRAAATRRALLDIGLDQHVNAAMIDWKKSKLPYGTQIVRLALSKRAFVLALRRNAQARLYELGTEGDSNIAFEKSAPFTLVLREGKWLNRAYPPELAKPGDKAVTEIQGTLDANNPAILMFTNDAPAELALDVPAQSEKLTPIAASIKPAENAGAALYEIRVEGPNGKERAHYGATIASKDGTLKHTFTPALNDPEGTWTISVRDLLSGANASRKIEIKETE